MAFIYSPASRKEIFRAAISAFLETANDTTDRYRRKLIHGQMDYLLYHIYIYQLIVLMTYIFKKLSKSYAIIKTNTLCTYCSKISQFLFYKYFTSFFNCLCHIYIIKIHHKVLIRDIQKKIILL